MRRSVGSICRSRWATEPSLTRDDRKAPLRRGFLFRAARCGQDRALAAVAPRSALESSARFRSRRSSRRSFGASFAVAPTTASVMQPPNTTDGTSPSRRAATPDSNAPSSFDEPMKMPLIDDTRPRMWSGVTSCRMVERSTTDTPSHRPDSISIAADSQNQRDSAKPMMHSPNPATANSSSRPAWRCGGRRASHSPATHRAGRRRRAQDAERLGPVRAGCRR